MHTMKKVSIVLALLLLAVPGHTKSTRVVLHDEVAGRFVFEQKNDKLYITAKLNSKQLALGLKREAQCASEDIMNACANAYIQEHFKVWVNHLPLAYCKVGHRFEGGYAIYTFEAFFAGTIQDIQIGSTYLLKHNSHATVVVTFFLNKRTRGFSLNTRRRRIQASYEL